MMKAAKAVEHRPAACVPQRSYTPLKYDQQRTKCPLGAQAGNLCSAAAAGDRSYSIAPRMITRRC